MDWKNVRPGDRGIIKKGACAGRRAIVEQINHSEKTVLVTIIAESKGLCVERTSLVNQYDFDEFEVTTVMADGRTFEGPRFECTTG